MDSQPFALHEPESTLPPQPRPRAASEDSLALPRSPRYCPTGLLAGFALLMAGRGRCVNTDMMLGDHEYAMWQLACARATDDAELVEVATRLLAYFDDPHSATPILGTA